MGPAAISFTSLLASICSNPVGTNLFYPEYHCFKPLAPDEESVPVTKIKLNLAELKKSRNSPGKSFEHLDSTVLEMK